MLYNENNKPLNVYAMIRGVRFAVKCDSSLTWTKDYQVSETITINVIAPGINNISAFDRFKLYIAGEKVYEGYVSSVNSASYMGSYEFNIEVSAWQSRLNYLYVNKRYNAKSISQIFEDLYNTFMIEEEITLGVISMPYDTFIESIEFGNGTSLYQALDKLASFGAYTWYIDKDLKIHFYVPKLNLGIVENIGPDYPFANLNINSKVGDFRTKEILTGENTVIDSVIDAYDLPFKMPVFTKSVNKIIHRYVENLADTSRIYNISEIGDRNDYNNDSLNFGAEVYDMYYFEDTKEIYTSLNLTNFEDSVFNIHYTGEFPITMALTDYAAMEKVKTRMGGSGKIEFSHEEQNIKSSDTAMAYAASQLESYSEFQGNVTFDIYTYSNEFLSDTDNPNNTRYVAYGPHNENNNGDNLFAGYAVNDNLKLNVSTGVTNCLHWKVGDLIQVRNNPLIKKGTYVISALTHTVSSSFHITTNVTMTENDVYDEYQAYWKTQNNQGGVATSNLLNAYDEVIYCVEYMTADITNKGVLTYPSFGDHNESNKGDNLYSGFGVNDNKYITDL